MASFFFFFFVFYTAIEKALIKGEYGCATDILLGLTLGFSHTNSLMWLRWLNPRVRVGRCVMDLSP